ncbi:helix-turn-helix domain-containing protein [Actinokineospora guangxiensis]|uniref:Helix-turn-helix domain-containing protein n=1 Tax=Actinokineospora guangxiensis TaxID=1490288 RepID=A0ABW0ET33_9PSEU
MLGRRKLGFHWNLRRLMAAHDLWKTTELIPLLRERGVELSPSQVYRLVTDKPERLSLTVLIALCAILDCTPTDLIEHGYATTTPAASPLSASSREHRFGFTSPHDFDIPMSGSSTSNAARRVSSSWNHWFRYPRRQP